MRSDLALPETGDLRQVLVLQETSPSLGPPEMCRKNLTRVSENGFPSYPPRNF